MAKRETALNEQFFPKVPLKFKETPVTNESGQGLVKCRKCEGHGTVATATRTIDEHNKKSRTETFGIVATDRKKWEKKGYTCTVDNCSVCRGAGLVVEGK
jgi:hypothetical protein